MNWVFLGQLLPGCGDSYEMGNVTYMQQDHRKLLGLKFKVTLRLHQSHPRA